MVGPGDYADDINLKAWVFVIGSGNQATRFTGDIVITDPSWGTPDAFNDERGGFSTCALTGTVVFDFTASNSLYGKVYMLDVNTINTMTLVAVHPINQAVYNGGQMFGGFTTTGMNVVLCNVAFQNGNISLLPSANAGVQTLVTIPGARSRATSR